MIPPPAAGCQRQPMQSGQEIDEWMCCIVPLLAGQQQVGG